MKLYTPFGITVTHELEDFEVILLLSWVMLAPVPRSVQHNSTVLRVTNTSGHTSEHQRQPMAAKQWTQHSHINSRNGRDNCLSFLPPDPASGQL